MAANSTHEQIQLEEGTVSSTTKSTANLTTESGPTFSGSSRLNRKTGGILIAVVVIAGLIALAIGLGVGLGSRSTTPPSPTGCGTLQHQYNTTQPNSKWLNQPCITDSQTCPKWFQDNPTLLLISMDGFRADYLLRNYTPVLNRVKECGTHAPLMRGVIPTKTFPNHYSIVTGLYPESHGIIANSMYDLEYGERFWLSGPGPRDGKWWQGEPIWVTSKKQGLNAATVFWPGTEADIQGIYPDVCYKYDIKLPFEARVDEAIRWLKLPDNERPRYMNLYFHEPDSAGHAVGPYDKTVNGSLARVDKAIERLMDKLTELGLQDCINIILTADHGMNTIKCDYVVELDKHIDINKYYIYGGVFGRMTSKYTGSGANINVQKPEDWIPVQQTLDELECRHDNLTKDWYMRIYKKQDLPKRYHYGNHRRIEDIYLDLEPDWIVKKQGKSGCSGGSHGWDPMTRSMGALFVAVGPAFKNKFTAEAFDNVELYNLFCDILGLMPAPNNGTQGSLSDMLKSPSIPPQPPTANSSYASCPLSTQMTQTDCQCVNLTAYTSKTVEQLNAQLNLTSAQAERSKKKKVPTATLR